MKEFLMSAGLMLAPVMAFHPGEETEPSAKVESVLAQDSSELAETTEPTGLVLEP